MSDPTLSTALTDGGVVAPDGPARVLVVDDEPSVVDVFREFMSGQGYDLTVAASGEEAVELIPKVRPDLILTDVNLPGVSGLEVMRFAKQFDPETCVIVVTGYTTASTAIEALRQGAYDYVKKPFDLDEVHRSAERGLADRRLKVQNRMLLEELRRKNEILRDHEQQLRERVRVATHQLTTLYEVGQEIAANLELGPRLALISAKAAEITGSAAAIVYLRREDTDQFVAEAAHGVQLSDDVEQAKFVAGEGVLGLCAFSAAPEQRASANGDEPFSPPGAPHSSFASTLAVPLIADKLVIGVLAVLSGAPFTDDELNFLVLFASQAASAIRNSQLFEHTKSLDRLKSEFVAVVSHEIRTPLTSVKGAIELLADESYFQNSDQQVKFLTIAHANAERLLVLISDILDFSKLDSASLPMSIERQRLEPVVLQATHNLRTLIEERRIHVEVSLADDLPDLMLDASRIAQVITNLLSNAIKFSPLGGRIEVTAEPWEGAVRVGVRDHGEGIAPDDLPKLFRKFSQIDSGPTRRVGGTGLGLVICKGIVEQHQGHIWVESIPGEGSTFYFTVPAAPREAPSLNAGA